MLGCCVLQGSKIEENPSSAPETVESLPSVCSESAGPVGELEELSVLLWDTRANCYLLLFGASYIL